MLSTAFGKQIYLDDNELLELTLATMDQLDAQFFLVIECQKGRICYASTSIETILGYKPVCRKKTEFFILIFFLFIKRRNYVYNLYLILLIPMILK